MRVRDESEETLEEFQQRWKESYARTNRVMAIFTILWISVWALFFWLVTPLSQL